MAAAETGQRETEFRGEQEDARDQFRPLFLEATELILRQAQDDGLRKQGLLQRSLVGLPFQFGNRRPHDAKVRAVLFNLPVVNLATFQAELLA